MLVLAIAAAAAPLAPIGKWNLDYQATNCILARQYGDPEKPVTLGWQAVPLMDQVDLLIAEPRHDAAFTTGKVDVDFGGQTGEGSFRSFPTGKSDKHLTLITAPMSLFVGRSEPLTATFRLHPGHTLSYRIDGSSAALASLHTCLDQTVVDWGLDPKALATIAVEAEPATDESTWLTVADYPLTEVRRGQQGISILLWRVDTTGHVADCRAVVPSGSKILDDAGCAALTKRARYTPAHDSSGKPVTTYRVRKIVWAMPGGLAGDH